MLDVSFTCDTFVVLVSRPMDTSDHRVEATDNPLITSDQLAQETGIAASTWRRWSREGICPEGTRIGKRKYWRRKVILAWLSEQESLNT